MEQEKSNHIIKHLSIIRPTFAEAHKKTAGAGSPEPKALRFSTPHNSRQGMIKDTIFNSYCWWNRNLLHSRCPFKMSVFMQSWFLNETSVCGWLYYFEMHLRDCLDLKELSLSSEGMERAEPHSTATKKVRYLYAKLKHNSNSFNVSIA